MIENDINNKKYIGKTMYSIEKRFREHIRDSSRRRKVHRPLYNAINKYGKEHFSIKAIEVVPRELAGERERYWIEYYNTYKHGYNATTGGDGTSTINYKKILKLYDSTKLSRKEIAKECNCCPESVSNIVSQYRDNINWVGRNTCKHVPNNLGITPKEVRCVENGLVFQSATQAANWLISTGAIKSQPYGRNKIPLACRGKIKTVGGHHWEYMSV